VAPPADGPPPPSGVIRSGRIAVVLVLGVLPIYLVMSQLIETVWPGVLVLISVLAAFALAYRWGLHRDRAFLASWLAVATVLAAVSAIVGLYNGLTDEPYVTPALARLWPNLYGSPITITYDQYGSWLTIHDQYNVYLPLLAFLRVPGFDYRWTSLGCWLATVYLLRRSGAAVVLFGAPWVALLAANGFNDFVPFVLLALALVTLRGWGARVAEYVALGAKQFANVVIVLLHLWHRRWRAAAVAVAVTVAWLVPFALLSPSGVVCHAILLEPHACGGGAASDLGAGLFVHINYYLWPIFLLAALGPGYVASLRGPAYARARARARSWWQDRRPGHEPSEAAVLLATPLVRLPSHEADPGG
jgi:hypothetical protein